MDAVARDLRWAVRSLMRSGGTTMAAVICLALGVGATTTVYTVLRALVLEPVPAVDASRLVVVSELPPNAPDGTSGVSPATWLDWRTSLSSFEAVAAYDWIFANLAVGESAERVSGHLVSGDFFAVLGAQAAAGRTLTPADEAADETIVLSDALWRRLLGADPDVIGSTVRVDGRSYTVVGVMDADFVFPAGAQYWLPLSLSPARAAARGPNGLQAIGRLADGVSVAAARAQVAAFEQTVARDWPAERAGWTAFVEPLQSWYGRNPRPFVLLLMAAVGFVVLIGCANVANLLLARATGRQREIAIRASLGASRARILRQFLTESVVLALVAGAVGALLALWGVLVFRQSLPAELVQFNPGWTRIGVDLPALLFTLTVAIGTGIVFGVAPALQAARGDLQAGLRSAARGTTTGLERRRLRASLVTAEVALALALLLTTGIMVRSLTGLMKRDPGFTVERVLTFDVALPRDVYDEAAERAVFFETFEDRLRAEAGAESVGLVSVLPMAWNDFATRARSEEMAGRAESELPVMRVRTATAGFFETLEVPINVGRGFTDERVDGPPVVLVSRRLAGTLWPGDDPLGKRVQLLGDDVWRTVVGVTGDVRHNPNMALELEAPTLYLPLSQRPLYDMSAVVRTTGAPGSFAATARAVLRDLAPDLAPGDVMTLARVRSNALSPQRVTTAVLAVFAGIALILAMVGVFGVVALGVRQRADEIGVRMALGADTGNVLRMVIIDGSRPVVFGIVLGVLAGLGLSRAVAGLVYDVSAADPLTFAVGTTVLAGVAFAACALPALRATRYHPARLLRHD